MIKTPVYQLELRLDGTLIGDVRRIAEDLKWVRRRTKAGVDEIGFRLNDIKFQEWCLARGTTINEMLRPFALDCRVIRNGIPLVGGFLATLPSYSPNGTSASLELKFDGYMNYLGGVYMYNATTKRPAGTFNGKMGALVDNWIKTAEARAEAAGKGFGLQMGYISDMAVVQYTFDNYKTIKDAIAERSDNTSGAGQFDVYFHPNRIYDVISDAEFGDIIQDYRVHYPAQLNGVSAVEISADEVQEIATSVIGVGDGEVSNIAAEHTAKTSFQTNSEAVMKYGYYETLVQQSSVTQQATLNTNTANELANASTVIWSPQVKLTGTQVAPVPDGEGKIWIGDTVTLFNEADLTGMTSGQFRVEELEVSVSSANAEDITPTLVNGPHSNNRSFTREFAKTKNELLNLKTASSGATPAVTNVTSPTNSTNGLRNVPTDKLNSGDKSKE